MFRHKKHLLFDLDHTLWDFETNAAECLTEIFNTHALEQVGISLHAFIDTFSNENRKLWTQLEQGQIAHEEIRIWRFKNTLARLGIEISKEKSEELNAQLVGLLPEKNKLIEGSQKILATLHRRYSLHILSNGYYEIQCRKLQNGNILHFFDTIITNDLAGFRKPDPRIFHYALKQIKADKSEALMIGDSLEADIYGAYTAGIEAVHFSPIPCDKTVPTISQLSELLQLL